MPENTGMYKKFNVSRQDGNDRPNAAYFVLDIVNDPFAIDAIRNYRISCEGRLPELANQLWELEQEMIAGNREGPMHQALRTSRQ